MTFFLYQWIFQLKFFKYWLYAFYFGYIDYPILYTPSITTCCQYKRKQKSILQKETIYFNIYILVTTRRTVSLLYLWSSVASPGSRSCPWRAVVRSWGQAGPMICPYTYKAGPLLDRNTVGHWLQTHHIMCNCYFWDAINLRVWLKLYYYNNKTLYSNITKFCHFQFV